MTSITDQLPTAITGNNNSVSAQTFSNLTQMPSSNQLYEFIESNNYIARLAFIVFVIFILIILIQLILRIVVYIYSPKKDITLLPGTMSADKPRSITQNMVTHTKTYIQPSTDRTYGIEFTWSVWIYVEQLNASGVYSNIFFKGITNPGLCNNINVPVNAPGLYIYNDESTHSATLYVLMDTFTKPGAYTDSMGTCHITDNKIPHMPLNSWVNIIMTVYGSKLDVYINGTIAKSIILEGVPKQNTGDVYVGAAHGFTGKISNLRYLSRKLYVDEIQQIVKKGPNHTSLDSKNSLDNYNYVSFNWYTNNV
jgi:hypothetical protein